MDDAAWKRAHVAALTDQQERLRQGRSKSSSHAPSHTPWALSDAPEDFVQTMLRGIVGFRFAITRLAGKAKMSQNREMADRHGVVAGLSGRGQGDDAEVAALVQMHATGQDG